MLDPMNYVKVNVRLKNISVFYIKRENVRNKLYIWEG